MTGNESIKDFVRDTLGCTCPDHVFEQIDDLPAASKSSPHSRSITIGGKLLLYIWEVDSPDQLVEGVPAILAAGKKARNVLGLNRFRAILVSGDPSTIKSRADLCFSKFSDLDEKMHLHVVSRQGLARM